MTASATRLESTRFGSIEVATDAVYTFPEGLPGLEGRRFALIADPHSTLVMWLQSLEAPATALLTVDPTLLTLPYSAAPKPPELRPILPEGEAVDTLQRRVIVRAGERPKELFFNLFAPIFFNPKRHLAMQVPLVGSGYDVREAWPPRPEARTPKEEP